MPAIDRLPLPLQKLQRVVLWFRHLGHKISLALLAYALFIFVGYMSGRGKGQMHRGHPHRESVGPAGINPGSLGPLPGRVDNDATTDAGIDFGQGGTSPTNPSARNRFDFDQCRPSSAARLFTQRREKKYASDDCLFRAEQMARGDWQMRRQSSELGNGLAAQSSRSNRGWSNL